QVPVRERPFTHELTYGTLRLRGRLDFMLAQLVRRGLDQVDADVLDVLRLGAYQLVEMHGVPAYAAVSQAVEQAKAVAGKGAGGFVNGVLQSLRRSAHTIVFPTLAEDPVARLSTWGSHPRWLVERWVARYGVQDAVALVDANNARPALYLRPIGIGAEEARVRLAAAGIDAERPDIGGLGAGSIVPDTLLLPAPVRVIDALAAVPAVIQDPAASLVASAVAAPPGAVVADLCAAPGGKAIVIAGARAAPSLVVACDVSVDRLERLRENVARVGVANVSVIAGDARRAPLARADVVLIDAPCTGTGTLRRHPDGRWRVTPEDLAALVTLQSEILAGAAALVPKGGALLYATCSLEAEENAMQVDEFLERHRDFVLEPIEEVHEAARDARGCVVVLPQKLGVDGAFAARLRRI
ncbi:MAG: 16S rRNA (cytosine(967)-C(5))-methyltransferase RsmB, partial [Longimicrobiales bacterium]